MPDLSPEATSNPEKPPVPWVTWAILASNLGVFLVQLYEYHRYKYDVVGTALAFSRQSFDNHSYWTLITYAWVHAVAMFGNVDYFWLHILTNMVVLFCLGPALEECLGPWRYLGLYLGGAVAAVLSWFFFKTDPGQSVIGASGAVFAVVGGAAAAEPDGSVEVPILFSLKFHLTLRLIALVIVGTEVAVVAFEWLLPWLSPSSTMLSGWLAHIGHAAHLGGALFGFAYVMVLRFVFRRKPVYG